METALLNHQVIGVSWMLGRELCKEGPWGGILGDEMGMGKTLQALGCIVSNRPTESDLEMHSKTTLIVAPATSIEQWKDEIRKHTSKKHIGTILHFKRSRDLELETLSTFGIILASYHEVSNQFPSKTLRAELQNDCGTIEEWKEKFDDNVGPLFRIPFWRIILDEAHNIKNKDSQMSVACQNLLGRHRWGMSGTPITNSLDELYPYFKFLKADWAGSLREFQYLYTNTADDESKDRLGVVMKMLMLRRTMSDRFMGRPLYEIPMCHTSVRRVKLTKEERVIYNLVETRFIEIVNTILRKPRKNRNSKAYLVFLLRLRQAAAHPILLEPVFKNVLTKSDLLEIKRHIKELDIAIASKEEDVCRLCYQELNDGYIAECEHVFCKECLDDHVRQDRRNGRVIPRCPDCNKALTNLEPLQQSDEEDSDIEGSMRRFNQHPKFRESHSRFLQECDQAHPKPAVPSAKTIAVKEAILKWLSEAPDDKIMIFLEFKITGAILGRMLEAEGIEFLYFFGDMTPVAKQNAVRGFREKKNIKVMIASFRCCSTSLNFTCANRVILVDLWWNIAIEMQAFARVFRISQNKETYLLRIIANNTIDNRMEALQKKKVKNISKVLEPGEMNKLTIEEIATLFGRLKKFDDGGLEIIPDTRADSESDEEFEETEEAEEIQL
ncbi:SNF2 family N-terminal domain-containing protein [Xylaria scruposa]|nr:SNF2 family N-terminal domain-containing protein [Xylaria scruposa]